MNKTKFNFNLWCLIVNSLIVKLFIDFSGFLLYVNNSGAVLSLLISVLIFLVLLLVFYAFRNYLAACMRKKYIRNVVYVIFTGYLICNAIFYLYRLVNLLSNYPYTNTPYYFILAVIIITALIIGIGDKTALFKLYGICVPFVIIGLIMIILNGARHIDLYNMLPVFGNGMNIMLSSGIKNVFAYSEILLPVVYAVLFKEKNTRYSFSAVLFGLILYACFFAVLFLTMPYGYLSQTGSESIVNLSRFSTLSRLNTRLDVINTVITLISSILYLSAVIVIIKKIMSDLGFDKIKLKRTSAALLIIALCIAPLCGCYDNRDVEDTAYAIAVGVDLSEKSDCLLFTFQFSNPLESGKNTDAAVAVGESETEEVEEDGNKSVNNISVTAPTVYEGIENIKNYIGKSPSLSHLKLIVLSDALINSGEAFSICGSFMEIMEVRPETKVCAADLAKEYLEAVNPTLEESTARYYELLFSDESATESLQIDLRTLLIKASLAVDDVYMPVMTERGFDGAVVFSGDYPVLTLNENDCRLLNIVFGNSSDFLYYTTEEGQSVRIKNRNKPKIKLYINNSEIYGDVEIKIKLSEIKNIDSANYENIRFELSQSIEELLNKIYAHNCDILSVKKHALKYFKYEYEWNAFLDNSDGITHINNIRVYI